MSTTPPTTPPATLITGASSGIGTAYAEHEAAHGRPLVLVARREDRLRDLADRLRSQHGVAVDVIALDLAVPGAAGALTDELAARGIEVGTLVNNAGIGAHGDVADADVASLSGQVQLNVTTPTELTVALLPAMVARGEGTVVNVASTAGFQPVPHMAVYAATKAYVLSFSQALWAETRGTGVRVLALCPGATDTEFFDHTGEAAQVGRRRTPEQVVRTAQRALDRGKPSVVDGAFNALTARVATKAPERLVIGIAERSVRP